MTHEPECLAVEEACICPMLRAAYRRGRDDAAKAVEAAWRESHILHTVISAARGDSPEEQAFKELIRHSQEIGLYEEAKSSTALDGQTIAIIPRGDGEQA